jgi:hypothetical protein
MKWPVVQGVYRHVRNPMISGLFFGPFEEAILAASLRVFCRFVIFVIGYAVNIPLAEEPGMVKRVASVGAGRGSATIIGWPTRSR